MRKMSWIAALVLVGASAVLSAQKADPDAQKIVDQYSAAFNKGDAKTLATLYAVNGRVWGRKALDRGTGDASKRTMQMGSRAR